MSDTMNQRIESLEMQLAHTQRTCEQLNEVVTELSIQMQKRDRVIDVLVRQTKDMKAKLEAAGEAPADEKPPHY